MSASSSSQNVETAQDLRSRLQEALDAFKQVSNLTIDHYIQIQQQLPETASREAPSFAAVEETLSEINKLTNLIVKAAWSARTVCDAAGIAPPNYLPLAVSEQAHRPPPGSVSTKESLPANRIDVEKLDSSPSSAKGKDRPGQVGQLALKFEQEAQQALKHAEESAPKPKLTRTFSYKEKQMNLINTTASSHSSTPAQTTSPPRSGPSKPPVTVAQKTVQPTNKKIPAPVPVAAKKSVGPSASPPAAKKPTSKSSTTDDKKKLPTKSLNPSPLKTATSKAVPLATKSPTTRTSTATKSAQGPPIETTITNAVSPQPSKTPEPARGLTEDTNGEASSLQPDCAPRLQQTDTPTTSSPPVEPENHEMEHSSSSPSATPDELSHLTPNDGVSVAETSADPVPSVNLAPKHDVVPIDLSPPGLAVAVIQPVEIVQADESTTVLEATEHVVAHSDEHEAKIVSGNHLAASVIDTDPRDNVGVQLSDPEAEPASAATKIATGNISNITVPNSDAGHDTRRTKRSKKGDIEKTEPVEGEKDEKASKKTEKMESTKGDRHDKGSKKPSMEKKKHKAAHGSDDALYHSDSAYSSDSLPSSSRRKKSTSKISDLESTVHSTKKKGKREKLSTDVAPDDETTAAGFPAIPGLLVTVEDSSDVAEASSTSQLVDVSGEEENLSRRHRFRNRTNTIDEGDLRSAKLHDVAALVGVPQPTSEPQPETSLTSTTESNSEADKRSRPTLQRAARSYGALSQSSTAVAQFQEALKAKRASSSTSSAQTEPLESPSESLQAPSEEIDPSRPRQPRRGASQGSGLTVSGAGPSIGRVLVRQVPRNRGIPLKSSKEAEARLKAEEVERERRLNKEKEMAAREAAENGEIEMMLAWENEIIEGTSTKRWEEMQKRKRKTISLDSKLKSSPTKTPKAKSESRTSVSSSSAQSSPSKQARPKKIAFRAAPAILYERNQNPRALKFEEEDSEDNIRFKEFNNETRIAAGTVEKLIQRLTYDKLTDTNYLTTFLLTYRSFMSPKELLDVLEVRWNTAPPAGTTNIDGWKTNVLYLIRLRISNVLKSWIEKYYAADFEGDADLLQQLDLFIDKIASSGLDKPAQQVRSMLDMKSEGKEKRSIEFSAATPRPRLAGIVPGKTSAQSLSFLDIDPLELARQLTSTEYRLFKAIAYKELLGTRWTKKDKAVQSPHVVEALQFSDRVVDWVATCILSQQDRTKRAQVLCRFISLGKLLVRMNNFNGAFEILSGLRSLGVMRLKRTWNMLPAAAWAAFDELERLFDPDGNWKRYRDALESAAPAVPHWNLFLSELIYINDKHPDTVSQGADNSLINFEKMWLIADIINKIQHYQEISYNILPVSIIEDYLSTCRTISALDQHEASLAREPEK